MWVRTASKRDLTTVSKLLGEVWHATYDAIYGVEKVSKITSEWHSVNALEKHLSKPASEFLVADDGKQIAAMAFASQINDNAVKLHQLYILPNFQGRGIGKMLLDEVEESFFEAREFVLEVEEKNSTAIGFYEKQGYIKTGNVEDCGQDASGIPALIFTKKR